MSLHIGIVIERYDPAGGGAERSTRQIADELIRRGHRVTILAASAPASSSKPDIAASTPSPTVCAMSETHSSSVFRLARFVRWVRRQLTQGDFDVSLSITNAVAADVMQPRGGTVRETLRRNIARRRTTASRWLKRLAIAFDPKQQLLLYLERRNLHSSRVRCIVAVSDYVKWQLQQHYGIAEDRIQVIHNAAVMPRLDPAQQQTLRTQMREKLELENHMTAFAFVAMNPALKGVDTLWWAMCRLVDRLEQENRTAGDAADKSATTMPVLLLVGRFGVEAKEHAQRLGLADHVRVVGLHDRTHEIYIAADVTVLPTFYDPSSKVVLESLMLGVPAISTAYNGASDFLKPGRGRVIAESDDDAALAEAMYELLDPAERAKCSSACAGLAEELSMIRHVDALAQVLTEAAE